MNCFHHLERAGQSFLRLIVFADLPIAVPYQSLYARISRVRGLPEDRVLHVSSTLKPVHRILGLGENRVVLPEPDHGPRRVRVTRVNR